MRYLFVVVCFFIMLTHMIAKSNTFSLETTKFLYALLGRDEYGTFNNNKVKKYDYKTDSNFEYLIVEVTND